jgi:heme A synthase
VGPEPTGGAVVVVAVVVVVVVVAGLLILMVGPPLPAQATVKGKKAMQVATARKAARRTIRSFTSHPSFRGLSIAIKDSPAQCE